MEGGRRLEKYSTDQPSFNPLLLILCEDCAKTNPSVQSWVRELG